MKHFFGRIMAALLCCMLISGSAMAGGLGIESRAAAYLDINNDVHFALSAQLSELIPYGEGTLEMLNKALEHVSVAASITGAGHTTALEINVAGDPVIGLTETVSENGSELTTPLLPNRVLATGGESALDAFLGEQEEAAAFDLFAAIEELEGCYRDLTDAIIPYAEEKKANYKIKDVATSKWSRIARLTAEQSEELAPLIAQVLGCGMDEAWREQLRNMSCGKGFIVGLYQLKQGGDDLALYLKGDVTFADGSKRELSYQWAFYEKSDGNRIDTFKYEMKKAKAPRDNREINAVYKRSMQDDKLLLDGECTAKIANPDTGVTVTTTTTHDLSGKENGGVRTVKGSMTEAVKTAKGDDSETVTITVKPDLKLTSSEGSGVLSGTASVEKKTGKLVHFSAVITFDEEPAEVFADAVDSGTLFVVTEDMMPPSSLTQNLERDEKPEKPDDFLVGKPPIGYVSHTAPEKETVVELDTIDDESRAVLMDELSQNLAGKLLIALSKLPMEDSALLQDNMSEEDYAAFLALVQGL